jgi:hypothetical protein
MGPCEIVVCGDITYCSTFSYPEGHMASGMIFASQAFVYVNGRGFGKPHNSTPRVTTLTTYRSPLCPIFGSHFIFTCFGSHRLLFFWVCFCHRLCFKCQQGNVAIYLRHSQAFTSALYFCPLVGKVPRNGPEKGVRASLPTPPRHCSSLTARFLGLATPRPPCPASPSSIEAVKDPFP